MKGKKPEMAEKKPPLAALTSSKLGLWFRPKPGRWEMEGKKPDDSVTTHHNVSGNWRKFLGAGGGEASSTLHPAVIV